MAVTDKDYEGLEPARPGSIANMEGKVLISRTVEDSGGLEFGAPVTQGTEDDQVVKATDSAFGVVVRTRSVPATCDDFDGFAQHDTARILTKGVIWVEADDTVTAGDDVHVDGGKFKASGGTAIAGARYDTGGETGDLVKVRLG